MQFDFSAQFVCYGGGGSCNGDDAPQHPKMMHKMAMKELKPNLWWENFQYSMNLLKICWFEPPLQYFIQMLEYFLFLHFQIISIDAFNSCGSLQESILWLFAEITICFTQIYFKLLVNFFVLKKIFFQKGSSIREKRPNVDFSNERQVVWHFKRELWKKKIFEQISNERSNFLYVYKSDLNLDGTFTRLSARRNRIRTYFLYRFSQVNWAISW